MTGHSINQNNITNNIKNAQKEFDDINSKRKEPYIARIDCGESFNSLHTAYIGRKEIPGHVVSWSNPYIGQIYYNTTMLSSRNDIVVAIKRIFEIKNAELLSFDDEINNYNNNLEYESSITKEDGSDPLLSKLLKISREDKKVHDIIKTIQGKQYDIISSEFEQDVLINGCAGSGKTMIMYHRISYIAYNYEMYYGVKFIPERVFVITPSNYFDSLNNELLENLSISKINNYPFKTHIESFINKYCDKEKIMPLYWLCSFCDNKNDSCQDYYTTDEFEKFYSLVEKTYNNVEYQDLYKNWMIDFANSLLEKQGFERLDKNSINNLYSIINSEKYYKNPCFIVKKNNENEEFIHRNIITNNSYDNILFSLESLDKRGKTYQKRIKKLAKYESLLKIATSSEIKYEADGTVSTSLDGFWSKFDDKITIFEKLLTLIVVERMFNCITTNKSPNLDYIARCCFVGSEIIPNEYLKNGQCLLY